LTFCSRKIEDIAHDKRLGRKRKDYNMKHLPTLLCATMIFASCVGPKVATPDAIDALVTKINATQWMWINGIYPIIELPSDSTPDQVLTAAVKVTGFDQGHIKTYKIHDIREVQLNTGQPETYSAALVESEFGPKIFLFKPEKNNRWWTRFYDVEEEKQNRDRERL